jgi:magnesium transporter
MPELSWRYGYPFALGLMTAIALAMLAAFWWKGWLRGTPAPRPGRSDH